MIEITIKYPFAGKPSIYFSYGSHYVAALHVEENLKHVPFPSHTLTMEQAQQLRDFLSQAIANHANGVPMVVDNLYEKIMKINSSKEVIEND